MTTTIERAKQAGAISQLGWDPLISDDRRVWGFFDEELEAFRALCVAERDAELLAVGMEPTHEVWISTDSCGEHYGWEDVDDLDERQWKNVEKSSHRYSYTATQLAAARTQGAKEERKKHCNCEWEGDVNTKQCTLHASHIDAIHEWAERAKYAEKRITELEQQLAEKREPLGYTKYRLLDRGEFLAGGDESLDDDCTGWTLILPIFRGHEYTPNFHVPHRRAIDAAHNIGGKHD